MTFRELFLTTADHELWQKYMPAQRSIYGSLGYAKIAERFLQRIPRLHVVESDRGWISYPMHLRPLSQLPFAGSHEGQWDSTTPEYTGPQIFGEGETLASGYGAIRVALARRHGIISEFAHLDPWSGAEQILKDGASLNRQIVWCDTTIAPEVLRRDHMEHRRRKSLKKCEREGLQVVEADDQESIRTFARIYQHTMTRNNALASYYMSHDYFNAFREMLPHNSRFTLTLYKGHPIGALFVLFDNHNAYAYMGGSDAAYHHLSPATYQIWDSICWAHRNGMKRLILGGGYSGDDGIFRFKISFSGQLQPFYTYKMIYSAGEYESLENACRQFHSLGQREISYFPTYRYAGSSTTAHDAASETQSADSPSQANADPVACR